MGSFRVHVDSYASKPDRETNRFIAPFFLFALPEAQVPATMPLVKLSVTALEVEM